MFRVESFEELEISRAKIIRLQGDSEATTAPGALARVRVKLLHGIGNTVAFEWRSEDYKLVTMAGILQGVRYFSSKESEEGSLLIQLQGVAELLRFNLNMSVYSIEDGGIASIYKPGDEDVEAGDDS